MDEENVFPCGNCAHSADGFDSNCKKCLSNTDPYKFPGYEPEKKTRKDPWDTVTFVLCSIMMVLAAVISTFNATGYLDGARITAIPYWAILAGYWAIRIWRQ